MPMPKEQPPRKLSGQTDRSVDNKLWRDPGKAAGAPKG